MNDDNVVQYFTTSIKALIMKIKSNVDVEIFFWVQRSFFSIFLLYFLAFSYCTSSIMASLQVSPPPLLLCMVPFMRQAFDANQGIILTIQTGAG
jgi:hypothetical protein